MHIVDAISSYVSHQTFWATRPLDNKVHLTKNGKLCFKRKCCFLNKCKKHSSTLISKFSWAKCKWKYLFCFKVTSSKYTVHLSECVWSMSSSPGSSWRGGGTSSAAHNQCVLRSVLVLVYRAAFGCSDSRVKRVTAPFREVDAGIVEVLLWSVSWNLVRNEKKKVCVMRVRRSFPQRILPT